MGLQTISTYPSLTRKVGFSLSRPSGPIAPVTIFWVAFVIATLAFVIRRLVPDLPGSVDFTLAAMSAGTCGLAWLFSRALFSNKARISRWPIGLVGALILSGIGLLIAGPYSETTALRYVGSLHSMLGSAMLVLIALEPLGASPASKPQRRLRFAFLAVYVTILAMALIARLPEAAAWQDNIQVSLAILAVLGATAALLYHQQGQGRGTAQTRPASRSADIVADPHLARRLIRCLEQETLYRRPGLKVSDLARTLNVPDYKVSQAIVHDLGHDNFNRLINVYRIKEAKARLSDPDEADTSILSVSLDCGFNSLGPFNRAFKAETGLTPTQFRQRGGLMSAAE